LANKGKGPTIGRPHGGKIIGWVTSQPEWFSSEANELDIDIVVVTLLTVPGIG